MLEDAYKLLKETSDECLRKIAHDKFFVGYAQEKRRHSFQVMGAGNYIIPRVEWLKNKDSSYIEMVKSAVLLHDICRFAEIEQKCLYKRRIDHGVAGAEFLRNISEFSDIRIWLPIKHHGHVIEALYDDEAYKNIGNADLRQEVERICFIIRDADKIANLRMLAYEKNMRYLFFGKKTVDPSADGHISSPVREDMDKYTTLPRWDEATPADRMAGYLSWYYDINYQYAIDFCDSLKVTPRLIELFEWICVDNDFKEPFLSRFTGFLQNHKYLR
ncbi:MAG: HD domain-containing protein [Pseudomonadota bacterium]|nr:HD domain-containing protein [Pseudomonadota bacterium]